MQEASSDRINWEGFTYKLDTDNFDEFFESLKKDKRVDWIGRQIRLYSQAQTINEFTTYEDSSIKLQSPKLSISKLNFIGNPKWSYHISGPYIVQKCRLNSDIKVSYLDGTYDLLAGAVGTIQFSCGKEGHCPVQAKIYFDTDRSKLKKVEDEYGVLGGGRRKTRRNRSHTKATRRRR